MSWMTRMMEEVRDCQPPNSSPKTWDTKITMEASKAPSTSALDTTVRAAPSVKPIVSRLAPPRFSGPAMKLNPSQKRKAPVAPVRSKVDKRVKKAPISKHPEVKRPIPGHATSTHDPFDDIEWHNSVLEGPEKLRLENSKALVDVYEGVLETLAQMDLDLRNLEEMMVDNGYIAEHAGKNDDAEGKEARSKQAESWEKGRS
ncbi:unnamed protein product [Penicillium crustosum]